MAQTTRGFGYCTPHILNIGDDLKGNAARLLDKNCLLEIVGYFDANFAGQFDHALSVFNGLLLSGFLIPNRLHFCVVFTDSVFCGFVGIVPEKVVKIRQTETGKLCLAHFLNFYLLVI